MLSHLFRRGKGKSKGQSLVEFALILPAFLLLFAGVLDLGRVFYAHITVNNAAREGAFQAARTPNSFQPNQPCDTATNMVVCRVQLEAKDSMVAVGDNDIKMTCSVGGCPDVAGSYVTVEVTGQFSLITPLLAGVFGGSTLNLGSTATAQIEYLPDPNTATLPPAPGAQFTASPTSGTEPLAVQFTDQSTGDPTSWMWDFDNDGTVDSTDQNPSHTYVVPGTYTVTLTAINLAGADVEVKTGYITVGAPTPTPTSTSTSGPTPTPTTGPTPTPVPCQYPPNVVGKTPADSAASLINAGFTNFVQYGDLTNGPKNRIQAQNPDHTQCIDPGTQIITHYRPS